MNSALMIPLRVPVSTNLPAVKYRGRFALGIIIQKQQDILISMPVFVCLVIMATVV